MNDQAPGEHGAEFRALLAELRQQRLEKARRDGAAAFDAIMAKAMDLLRAGKLVVFITLSERIRTHHTVLPGDRAREITGDFAEYHPFKDMPLAAAVEVVEGVLESLLLPPPPTQGSP